MLRPADGRQGRCEADPTLKARYPYRILKPEPGAFGRGILSKLPLVTAAQTSLITACCATHE